MISIDVFDENYNFLSPNYKFNFLNISIQKEFISLQHAFQFHKTFDQEFRMMILEIEDPKDVYTFGQKSPQRNDWHNTKYFIMKMLLKERFLNENLRQLLINTGNSFITMNNTITPYWGIVGGAGENIYGKLLMQLRTNFLKTY